MASGDAYDGFLITARSEGDAAAELNGWTVSRGFGAVFDRREASALACGGGRG
jgi:hypothetical protein